jgi:ribosome-associated translation inhibitor RaiA
MMGGPRSGPHGRGWSARHQASRTTEAAGHETAPPEQADGFPVTISAGAEIDPNIRRHAREAVRRTAKHAPHRVLHARVALELHRDPALDRPAVAKISLDVRGRPVRAHVAAGHLVQAIDLAADRLRESLEDLERIERSSRRGAGVAGPGRWRHRSVRAARPAYYPRPVEERYVVRRKTFALSPLTPERAVLEMDLLDYDFHLFVNVDTGEEAVVHRNTDGTLALAAVTPSAQARALPIELDPVPAPVMPLGKAVDLLDASGMPFTFFVDAQTRRGNVLYRRYDGHYGLIEPAT